jgi:hypothetical protein
MLHVQAGHTSDIQGVNVSEWKKRSLSIIYHQKVGGFIIKSIGEMGNITWCNFPSEKKK